jgi:hypothetical protein
MRRGLNGDRDGNPEIHPKQGCQDPKISVIRMHIGKEEIFVQHTEQLRI